MSSKHWDRLDAVADRISELTGRAHIASAQGDEEQAVYFIRQAHQAELERQKVIEELFGDIVQ